MNVLFEALGLSKAAGQREYFLPIGIIPEKKDTSEKKWVATFFLNTLSIVFLIHYFKAH